MNRTLRWLVPLDERLEHAIHLSGPDPAVALLGDFEDQIQNPPHALPRERRYVDERHRAEERRTFDDRHSPALRRVRVLLGDQIPFVDRHDKCTAAFPCIGRHPNVLHVQAIGRIHDEHANIRAVDRPLGAQCRIELDLILYFRSPS